MSANITSTKGFYGWVNLVVTSIIGVLAMSYMVSFSYFLPSLLDEFGWARGVTNLAASIYMIAMGLCGPFAGFFIFKYGARRAMVLGNSLALLGFLIMFFHNQLWQLFLGYGVLVGVAAGLGGMLAGMTVINDWFVKKRAMALSLFMGSGGFIGMFTGRAITAAIETYGWRNTTLIMASLILLLAIILPAILIRNKPRDMDQVPDGPENETDDIGKTVPPKPTYRTTVDFTAKEALKTRCMWLLVLYFCLSMLAMGAIMTNQIVYLEDIGISAAVASWALGVMSGFMAFGQLGVGFISKRFSMRAIVIFGETLKLIGLVILIFSESLPFVFFYMIVLGLGFGFGMAAMMNIFPNYFGVTHYPKIMGTVRLFWTFIGAAGAPLAGHIRDITGSFLPAFQVAVVITALGLVCLICAKAPIHPSLKVPKTDIDLSPAS